MWIREVVVYSSTKEIIEVGYFVPGLRKLQHWSVFRGGYSFLDSGKNNFCAGIDPRISELGFCVWNPSLNLPAHSRNAVIRGSAVSQSGF